jgi:restriction system protein
VPRSSSYSDPERVRRERIERQISREHRVEANRAQAQAERSAKQREREARDLERATRVVAAERRTGQLDRQVAELESILRRCVARAPLTFADLIKYRPTDFDPGVDGLELPEPRRPVMPEGGWFSRRTRREWFARQVELYERARDRYDAEESARRERIAAAASAHERREAERRSSARRRAAALSSGVRDGEPRAIEEFARLAIETLPMPRSIRLEPSVVYRTDPRDVVVDLRLPDDDVVPAEKSVKHVQSRGEDSVRERPRAERESIYRAVLAQLPLVAANAVFSALGSDVVGSVSINGKLTFVDPATGRQNDDFLVSLTTGRDEFAKLNLEAEQLDPVLCIRELGARLSDHPLAHSSVPPFLTFDEAKYKLGTSVDVASDLDGRANLATMPWADFEQLVRQLLLAMQDGDVKVTRGSRDDPRRRVHRAGEALQERRPAIDVRALAGTMHDKRANHALFVTTAWFSPDGRRFAKENRVRLIEGPELRSLLLKHLELDVLIPPYRGHPRRAEESG